MNHNLIILIHIVFRLRDNDMLIRACQLITLLSYFCLSSAFAFSLFGNTPTATSTSQTPSVNNASISPQDFKTLVNTLGQQNLNSLDQQLSTQASQHAATSPSSIDATPTSSTNNPIPSPVNQNNTTSTTSTLPPATTPNQNQSAAAPPQNTNLSNTPPSINLPSSQSPSTYTGFGGSSGKTNTAPLNQPANRGGGFNINY